MFLLHSSLGVYIRLHRLGAFQVFSLAFSEKSVAENAFLELVLFFLQQNLQFLHEKPAHEFVFPLF